MALDDGAEELQSDMATLEDKIPLVNSVSDEGTTRGKTKHFGCLGTILILLLIIIVGGVAAVLLVSRDADDDNSTSSTITSHCMSRQCIMSLVETIPTNLTYNGSGSSFDHLSTFDAWNMLMSNTNATLNIASYYWTLRGYGNSSGPTDQLGLQIFDKIKETALRGVKVKIVQNDPTGTSWGRDTAKLAELGIAVQSMNFTMLIGAGILHTKLWIADNLHFYVGSANTDWRSLTEVKELGLLGINCPCLAEDINKIFTVYWELSKPKAAVPDKWPSYLATTWNMANPVRLQLNNSDAEVYAASSPPQLCPPGRTADIDALLNVIQAANKFICIAVMDYYSAMIYSQPQMFWPIIDDALRSAVYNRGIKVRVMGSIWEHTEPDMIKFLKSLQSINGSGQNNGTLEVRLFKVPPTEPVVPYTRVNHNKYMVTDNAAYIGTSNWSGDYFVNTGGVSCIVNQTDTNVVNGSIQEQLLVIFNRDWYSDYTISI